MSENSHLKSKDPSLQTPLPWSKRPEALGWQQITTGSLRNFSLACETNLSFLLDTDKNSSSKDALAVLAGQVQSPTGIVRVFGADPRADASVRKQIGLIGNPAYLADILLEDLPFLAHLRGVSWPPSNVPSHVLSVVGGDKTALKAAFKSLPHLAQHWIAFHLSNAANAKLLLVCFPEQLGDRELSQLVSNSIRDALARDARVIVATKQLESLLSLAVHDATGAIVSNGSVVSVGSAHHLPWMVPQDGRSTRIVRVSLAPLPAPVQAIEPIAPETSLGGVDAPKEVEANNDLAAQEETASEASLQAPTLVEPGEATEPVIGEVHPGEVAEKSIERHHVLDYANALAARLLANEAVAPLIARWEVPRPEELLLHARDARAVARAIAFEAKCGAPVVELTVFGADSAHIGSFYRGGLP